MPNTALIFACSVEEQEAPADVVKPLLKMNLISLAADTYVSLVAKKTHAVATMRKVRVFVMFNCGK